MNLMQRAILLGLALFATTGCAGRVINGLVVVGPQSEVSTARVGDQLDQGLIRLADARVQLTLDPNQMGQQTLGTVITDTDGRFTMPVRKTGMGVLKYSLGVSCRKTNFAPAVAVVQLPGSGQLLLIKMAPGLDRVPVDQENVGDDMVLPRN